ncbi:MAG TPA: PfkB family carbohydrate kinase [Candidatus Limnocylindrales bacterium]|nr:PfkB family carbohydrate kinase [Candidatus Limnocylindrales bacterium]
MSELLIVGGLTIDRFLDGTVAPGGSVLHSGLAAASDDVALTLLTVAGDEPAARDGLARLASIGKVVHQPAASTTVYRHEERNGARVLIFEAGTDPITGSDLERLPRPDVALVAPIADEVPAELVERLLGEGAARTVMLIQGWLRRLEVGEEVHPLPLAALSAEQVRVTARADAIVVSTEDLTEAPGDPFRQAAELRQRVGPLPIVVVTLGTEGYLLDDPAANRLIASVPRRVVTGVSAVGAGDTFGAALALNLARGVGARAAADLATDHVIAMLEARRSAAGLGP